MDALRRTPSKNPGLQIYHDVLGLDELHYGIWNGEALTFENLKTAKKTLQTLLFAGHSGGRLRLGTG